MLHHVALSSNGFQNSGVETDLKPLAEALDAQLWGLLPGFHRLVFEGGQVLLTLCIGDVQTLLKQQWFEADSVSLNLSDLADTDMLYTLKAIARLCRRGTALQACGQAASLHALQAAFQQCGFEISESDVLQASYNPAWSSKKPNKSLPASQPGSCVVIGAGLAGAAVASSLGRRGWSVTVIDSASQPASGASSLPAGLLVPHTSPDDSPISRLSRCGVRMTLQQARALLRHGTDWGHTGVLQRSLQSESLHLPPAWALNQSHAASDWCYSASPQTLAAAGLPPSSTALWHVKAGWLKPSALVKAWLTNNDASPGVSPGVKWRGDATAAQLKSANGTWLVLDAAGGLLTQADVVVISAGIDSRALIAALALPPPDLRAIRGQVTFGVQTDSVQLPPFPVNGHGGLIPGITTLEGPQWLMGASYERDRVEPDIKAQDHAENLVRLQTLLPPAADVLANAFKGPQAQGWAGIRCATPNRLPLVMPLPGVNQVWLCTGMGSRGLSFAALCAELLAAQLHREPLPVDKRLAQAMQQAA